MLILLRWGTVSPHARRRIWRTTSCRLSATAYSVHLRIHHPQSEDAWCRGDKGLMCYGPFSLNKFLFEKSLT